VRVLLLNQYYAPDEAPTARLLADVGEELARAGHEVRAIASRRAYADPSRRYPARETIAGVEVVRHRTTGFGREGRTGRLADYATFLAGTTASVAAGPRADVVVVLTTPPMLATAAMVASRLRGARVVYWVMDVYPDLAFRLGVLDPGSAAGRLLARVARMTLSRADRVVTLGERMAERLRAAGASDPVVIHNWADGDEVHPIDRAAHPLRRENGWDDRFVVMHSGNMGLAHEFETMLDAASALADRPSVRFVCVGGGPRRAEVEREVRRRGLAHVELRPYVPTAELGRSLTAADLHLVTLRADVAGLLVPSKIYGILAAGRPTAYVGPDDGEVAEILRAGDCGVRIANGDGAGLAAEIVRHEGDPARTEREGARARALFEERFDRRRAVRAFRGVIESLSARGGSTGRR
jgi:glycosyltransferase involved in cell wall biosynthesis